MGQDGSIFTCANHPTLRWANTKPGGSIFFMGEILEDGTLKPGYVLSPIPHLTVLKARLGGYNPYNKDIPEEAFTTFEEVAELVDYFRHLDQKWAFECPCPGSDLIVLDDETYETVSAREVRDAS